MNSIGLTLLQHFPTVYIIIVEKKLRNIDIIFNNYAMISDVGG